MKMINEHHARIADLESQVQKLVAEREGNISTMRMLKKWIDDLWVENKCIKSTIYEMPGTGDTRPREYYKPCDIDSDYRELVKEHGSNNVKIFREIDVVISPKDDHSEYLEYKREIMEMDEQSAAKEDD